jgi:sulfhydrogenase subunit beta (sulfur reductase)
VACSTPAETCFCTSMGTGPAPGAGYDLALTEVLDEDGHRFVVRVGTDRGEEVLRHVPQRPVEPTDDDAATAVVQTAADTIDRHLDTSGLPSVLDAEVEHPLWEEVAQRCLACGNCTAVCPTCFCTSVEDVSDLSGDIDERNRVWDSCFSQEYSQLHGGAVRTSTSARYRQWLTHKLAAWPEQFGMSGCVGCGRCITWCPAAIDLTAEVVALRNEAEHRVAERSAAHMSSPNH